MEVHEIHQVRYHLMIGLQKTTGRFALLLSFRAKREFMMRIEPQYAALISYLDETGQNELGAKDN